MRIIELCATLAATAAAYVAYLAFRNATDPEVIVYVDFDDEISTVAFLVIKNIGNGPAYNITFSSSQPIPHNAFGIESLDRELKHHNTGPIAEGLPFLAPQQEIRIMWGQYGGIIESTDNKTISIISKYHRKQPPFPFKSTVLHSASSLFIKEFAGIHSPEKNYLKTISVELKKIAQQQFDIKNYLRKVSEKLDRNND